MAITVWPVDAVAGAPVYAGRSLRQASVAPFLAGATPARPLGSMSGVRPGTGSPVAVSSTTWSIGAHAGVIDAEVAAEAGPYAYSIDAGISGAMTAANASNARTDLLSLQVSDPAEKGSSTVPGLSVVYLVGVADGSLTVPATPARALAVARINVPKAGGGSPTATWVAPSLAAAGGKLVVPTLALLNLAPGWDGAEARVYADPTAYANGSYAWNSTSKTWTQSSGDTGWVLMTGLQTSFTASPAYPPRYRKINGVVYLDGEFFRSQPPTTRATAFILPAGFWPKSFFAQPVLTQAVPSDISIDPTSGAIGVVSSAARTASPGYPLTGISYRVD